VNFDNEYKCFFEQRYILTL